MNNLETKQQRYNILVSRILQEKANVAKGLFEIGLGLKEIKERELYLLDFRSFEEFLKKKVEISKRTAYRCISITQEFDVRDFIKWGLYKLEIIKREFPQETQVKERKEFIKEGSAEPGKLVEPQISNFKTEHNIKELVRFKNQSGKKRESSEEEVYSLIRQFKKLEEFKAAFKESLANWLNSAKKHTENKEICELLVQAEEMEEQLKSA